MHMQIRELKTHKKELISQLEIVSMEGRYYMARFRLDGDDYVLTDTDDKPMMFTGACAVRDYFHDYTVGKIEVIPPTGTDEMIGMPATEDEAMRVPL